MTVAFHSPNPPTPLEAVEAFRAALITALAQATGEPFTNAGLLKAISITATLKATP